MNELNASQELERRKRLAVDQWFTLFDDLDLRRECPSTYHERLLREADELDRLGLVEWTQWCDLRRLADHAFLKAVAGADYHPAGQVTGTRAKAWVCLTPVHAPSGEPSMPSCA